MSRHTVVPYRAWISERRRARPGERVDRARVGEAIDGEPQNVADIGHSGISLQTVAEVGFQAQRAAPLRDDTTFTRFDHVVAAGCVLRCVCAAGRYGLNGEIVDVVTGAVVGQLSENHAPLTGLRNALIVPLHGTAALLLCERTAGQGASSTLQRTLRQLVEDRFDGQYILHFEALANQAAWDRALERAQLEAITAVRYDKTDTADRKRSVRIGAVAVQKVGYGNHKLPRRLLERAIRGEVPPHELVGLSEPFDADEVKIRVSYPEGEKTFVVGREKPPSIAEVIAEEGEARPDDSTFFSRTLRLVPSLAEQAEISLPPNWNPPESPR